MQFNLLLSWLVFGHDQADRQHVLDDVIPSTFFDLLQELGSLGIFRFPQAIRVHDIEGKELQRNLRLAANVYSDEQEEHVGAGDELENKVVSFVQHQYPDRQHEAPDERVDGSVDGIPELCVSCGPGHQRSNKDDVRGFKQE